MKSNAERLKFAKQALHLLPRYLSISTILSQIKYLNLFFKYDFLLEIFFQIN